MGDAPELAEEQGELPTDRASPPQARLGSASVFAIGQVASSSEKWGYSLHWPHPSTARINWTEYMQHG